MTSADHEYVRRSSFEAGAVEDWSVTEDRVALLSDATVSLVGEDHDDISLDADGEYVALNDKLFVYAGGRVEAYSVSGTRLWGEPVEDVAGLAAPTGSDVVVVLTADDQLLGLDASSGRERFRNDRPDADVATTPELVCADRSLVVAAWSFLSVLSPEGETELRTPLDGAIHGVGVVDDTVVCVMKDDRLLGIDADSGDQQWSHAWDVDRIAPFGRGELLVSTSEGVRAVTADGEWAELALDDGLPIAAADGDPVCVLVDSLVNVYARTEPGDVDVTAAVATDVLEQSAGSVPVEVENVGDSLAATTVAVEADGASVSTGAERLTLGPGERERVRVGVSDVADDEVDVAVRVDDEVATEATLPVSGGVNALDVTAAPSERTPDGWRVEVTVENATGVTVRDVELLPAGERTDRLPPGEAWTATVPLPEDDALVLSTPDERTRLDVAAPADLLTAEVGVSDGLVVVEVANESGATVTDDLSAASEAFPRDLDVSFDGGPDSRLVLAVPPVREGDVSVTVEGGLLSHSATVSVPGDAVVGQTGGGTGRTPNAGSPDDVGAGEYVVELGRRFEPEQPVLGELQFEYVDATNVGNAPREVTVQAADGPEISDVVPPGETRSYVRAHAFTAPAGEVPPVAVETPAGKRSTKAVETSTREPDCFCRAAVVPGPEGRRLRLEFMNRSRSRVTVTDVSLRSLTPAEPVSSFELGPRSTETVTVPLRDGDVDDAALVSYTTDAGTRTTHQTLAHVPDVEQRGLAHVDVVVDRETVLDADGGTVVLAVRNDGTAPLSDVTLSASGEQVQTMLYEDHHVESLAPGETVHHYVDVKGTADGLRVPVELGLGSGATETMRVVADAPDPASVVAERPELPDPDTDDVSVPPRVSTSFSVDDDSPPGA